MLKVTEETLDINAICNLVSSPSAGAISTFIGTTRNYTGKNKVKYLVYEAYHSMAISMMKKLAAEVEAKYDIEKIAIHHRIGKVDIEEASVVIAVSSGHRKPAIQACHYAIDRLKEIVPIWKKEFMEDGKEEWIANCTNCTHDHTAASSHTL